MFENEFENSEGNDPKDVKSVIDSLDEEFPEHEDELGQQSDSLEKDESDMQVKQELEEEFSVNKTTSAHEQRSIREIEDFELPKIQLLRDDEDKVLETIQYLPQSLMNIIVEDTGQGMMTSIQMKDNQGQIRYNASSGGTNHHWITRIQNTRSFGEWRFVIQCPLSELEEEITFEVPFYIVKELKPLPSDRIIEEKVVEEPVPIVAEEEEIIGEIVEEPEVPEIEPGVVMDLTSISGIGPTRKVNFENEGFFTVESIAEASLEELQKVKGIGAATSRKIKNNALELLGREVDLKIVPAEQPPPEIDKTDLSSITGIGSKTKQAFQEAGFNTPEDVAHASLERLQEIKGVGPTTAKKFKKEAIELLDLEIKIPTKPKIVKKVFDAEDLTQISGIGPKSQLMFENAGYTTIQDIANAPIEDLQKLRGFGSATSKKIKDHANEILKELWK